MELAQDDHEDFGDDHDELPIGYKFVPTDEELVTHYLINKVLCNPLPASVFQDIEASQLFSKPPKNSDVQLLNSRYFAFAWYVTVQFSGGEREWFFFIHHDDGNFNEEKKAIHRIVGDGRGLGFWKSAQVKPLFDINGNMLAWKIHLIYFTGGLNSKAKKTHWRIDEFRLPMKFYTLHNFKEEWALVRLRRGRDFNQVFYQE